MTDLDQMEIKAYLMGQWDAIDSVMRSPRMNRPQREVLARHANGVRKQLEALGVEFRDHDQTPASTASLRDSYRVPVTCPACRCTTYVGIGVAPYEAEIARLRRLLDDARSVLGDCALALDRTTNIALAHDVSNAVMRIEMGLTPTPGGTNA